MNDHFYDDFSKLCQETVPEKPKYVKAKLVHYNYDLTKSWYVDYQIWDVTENALIRHRQTFGFNRKKGMHDRLRHFEQAVIILNGQLRAGKTTGNQPRVIKKGPKKFTLVEAIEHVRVQKELNGNRINYTRKFKTVENAIKEYLEYRKQPDFYLREFDGDDAQDIFEWLRDVKTLQNKSINNFFTNLGIVFNQMEQEFDGIWRRSPLRKIPTLRVISKKHAAYNDAQIKIIDEAIDQYIAGLEAKHLPRYQQLKLFIQFIYYTLARPNTEVATLRVRNIQIDQGRIYFQGEDAKNKRDEYVPLSEKLQMEIQKSGILNFPPGDYIFTKHGIPGPVPVGNTFFWRKHREILKKTSLLDVNENFSIYSYKHSGAISLWRATKDIKVVQRQCRHQSIAQTDEYLRDLGEDTNYKEVSKWKGAF